jgi:hypothetical protein
MHCKKGLRFYVTSQILPGQEKLNYSRQERVWLVTSRLGTGKSQTFFTVCAFLDKEEGYHGGDVCETVRPGESTLAKATKPMQPQEKPGFLVAAVTQEC